MPRLRRPAPDLSPDWNEIRPLLSRPEVRATGPYTAMPAPRGPALTASDGAPHARLSQIDAGRRSLQCQSFARDLLSWSHCSHGAPSAALPDLDRGGRPHPGAAVAEWAATRTSDQACGAHG